MDQPLPPDGRPSFRGTLAREAPARAPSWAGRRPSGPPSCAAAPAPLLTGILTRLSSSPPQGPSLALPSAVPSVPGSWHLLSCVPSSHGGGLH